ncbi:unnamed protein product [Candidula unifasciata]|uniref:Homeobox domain-containing protein n=1 Tax=Candidula unifasciata TaxID=100452 RepID=A0A8S3Z999_9EUPU|nr:unnamed protein product [Candidula unifasciata]
MLPTPYTNVYVSDGFPYCLVPGGVREVWQQNPVFSHNNNNNNNDPLDMSSSLPSLTATCQLRNSVRTPPSVDTGSSFNRSPTPDSQPACRQSNIPVKPYLTFSIERILGLTGDVSSSCRNDEETGFSVENTFCDDDSGDEIINVDDVKEETTDVSTDNTGKELSDVDIITPKYQWLQCTRYHPPKLQRNKQKEGTKKRKLGRNPRVPFTQHQVVVLEDRFKQTHYLSSLDVAELSNMLGLTEPRVKIWFQNRRARDRREREAAQSSQKNAPQKTLLPPLSVPSVSWPSQASIAASYVPSSNTVDFRPSYISSSFRV